VLPSVNRNLTSTRIPQEVSLADQSDTSIRVVGSIATPASTSARPSASDESSTTTFDQSLTTIKDDDDRASPIAPESAHTRTSVSNVVVSVRSFKTKTRLLLQTLSFGRRLEWRHTPSTTVKKKTKKSS
jgi:hypothetical protein